MLTLFQRFKMRVLILFFLFFFGIHSMGFSQTGKWKKFRQLSAAEKCWVMVHPFVAKKALKATEEARAMTLQIIKRKELKGDGNGGQVDAFRHTFWMARLTKEIGAKRAKSLGNAHEKGNYKDYKKRRLEDGVVPDEISSEMDYFNNAIGIDIGLMTSDNDLKNIVVTAVRSGKCKIIKRNKKGIFLDIEGKLIREEDLKGKWENERCLVWSSAIVD